MLSKSILAAALAAVSLAAAATDYYVVAPLPGKTINASAISVALAQSSLPVGQVGAAYTYDFKQHLQVSGDAGYVGYGVKWAVSSGALPAGLVLNADTGVVSGSPSAEGTASFEVSAAYKTKSGLAGYQVTVATITVGLTNAVLTSGKVGTAYSYDFKPLLTVDNDATYTGAGVSWDILSGSLPVGVTLNSAAGTIAGTPLAVGASTFTLRATYKSKPASSTFALSVADAGDVVLNGTYRSWSDGTYAASCNGYLTGAGGHVYGGAQSGSGVYRIKPAGQPEMDAYCDMTGSGGGWMLVLNYLHKGGTNPNLAVLTTRLPLLAGSVLGTDESASSTSWGHTAPAMLSLLTFSEVRMSCNTMGTSRIMDFKTDSAAVLSYFKTGMGSMTGFTYTTLPGHTAYLPVSIVSYYANQGSSAMTEFPFYRSGAYHWGIKGLSNRWECDDYPNNSTLHTHHRIWVR